MDCFTRFLSLLPPGDTVVVACPGVPDSVCLCHRLWTAPNRTFSLLAAHLNHGLRGEESDGDEAFVRTLCQRWGIPLTVKRLAEGELAAQKGLSLEEAGRQARYGWFSQLLAEDERRVLVTAHTASDQAETLLFFMSQGAAPWRDWGVFPISGEGFTVPCWTSPGRQCGTTAPPTGWTTGRIPPTAPWITPATVSGSR